ncbi:hypothetical protein Sgleb_63810 [Streptomyces glebosus]|uniref:Uncharacterized protein n=1 Tax=Streptomyces glebosus TaxID=249580 RepID=A0A640T550_9ACTN|nr:hypothetical protein Sgleb_63810 [Streptomyces glebosus]
MVEVPQWDADERAGRSGRAAAGRRAAEQWLNYSGSWPAAEGGAGRVAAPILVWTTGIGVVRAGGVRWRNGP